MVEPVSLLAGGALAGGALAGAAVFAALRRRQARARSWHAAARRLGLGDTVESPRRWPRGPVLTARSEELGIRLEGYRRGRPESGTRIVIDGPGPGAEALALRHEGMGMRLFGPDDLTTGDAAFDQAVHVQGPRPLSGGAGTDRGRLTGPPPDPALWTQSSLKCSVSWSAAPPFLPARGERRLGSIDYPF